MPSYCRIVTFWKATPPIKAIDRGAQGWRPPFWGSPLSKIADKRKWRDGYRILRRSGEPVYCLMYVNTPVPMTLINHMLQVVRRSPDSHRFEVLPRRRVVERTLA